MNKLYYCYDALCGWCYGFSPVITNFVEKHRGEFDLTVVSGGMITGERVGPIGEVAGYISQAYKVVEERCGVRFGEGFLKGILAPGKAVFTSVPPAVAMVAFRELIPKKQLAYATALQKAIYYDGVEPQNLDAYADRAATLGADRDEFRAMLDDPKYTKLAEEDFRRTAHFSITGFPTVVYVGEGGQMYGLTKGYIPYGQLEANWERISSSR